MRAPQTRDRFGNALNLTYNSGLLSQAQAAGGQTLAFTYTDGYLTSITDNAGHTFTLGYSSGLLTSLSDPLGATYTLAYTSTLLASIGDPRGVTTAFAYDGRRRLQSVVVAGTPLASFAYLTSTSVFSDANGVPITYTLNGSGQATVVTDAFSNQTSFAFDANYNVVQTVDALGRVSRAAYDSAGNVISRTDALTQSTLFAYNATNDLTSVTDALSRQTRYGYDGAGNLTVITDALGVTTTFGYDGYGQRTRATDANGNSTLFAYSSAGYLITTTDALSNRVVAACDAVGNRTSVTDARGNATTTSYDAANRLVAVTAPLTIGVTATTRYGYDSVGNRTVITDALVGTGTPPRAPTTFGYDALNRTVAVTDALGHRTQSGYDAAGNRLTLTDANGNVTRYGYDRLNRTIAITSPVSSIVTQFQYDAVGNRTAVTDPRGHTTTVGYDALNRVITTSVPLTASQFALTQVQYDPLGNRTVITDANTHRTQYGFDRLNRTVAITDANVHTTTIGYDRAGNRLAITDTGGFTTTFRYDALNRVLTTTNPSGASQAVTYDPNGNRVASTDELGRVTRYVYDAANRLVAQTDPLTQTTAYAYDVVGNLTRLTGPKNQGITVTFGLTYTYDTANRLTAKQTLIGTTGYAYDSAANLLTLTDPSGAYSAFTYDAANRLTQQEDHAVGGALTVSTTHSYDPNGNRTNSTEFYVGFTRATDSTYDHANRLVSESGPGGVTGYSYDAVGNRTGTSDPLGVTTVVTPNTLNLPAQTTHWQNDGLLDTTSTTYDARSNPLSAQSVVTTFGGNLYVTSTYAFNSSGYLTATNHASSGYYAPGAATNGVAYYDNNLLRTLTPTNGDLYQVYYDSADRVRCYKPGYYNSLVAWSYFPDGNRQFQYDGFHPTLYHCEDMEPEPPRQATGASVTREWFVYDGQRLTRREWRSWYPDDSTLHQASNYQYDGTGHLATEVHANYDASPVVTTTTRYTWTWQGGAYRLTQFVAASGVTTTLDYDRQGRIIRRTTALGHSDYIYEGASDWLLREAWHASISHNEFDLVRYRYTAGRPTRVDLALISSDQQTFYGYDAQIYYVQYNYHGDASFMVGTGGNLYGGSHDAYDPWGTNTASGAQYYGWNAAWGYLWFNDLGLYYVHGRWYAPGVGRFIEPDDRGEYLYGSGNDAVNFVWGSSKTRTRPDTTGFENARVYFLNAIGSYPAATIISPNPDPKDEQGYYLYRMEQIVGPGNVRHIPIYVLDDNFKSFQRLTDPVGYARLQMWAEMLDYRIWSPKVANFIIHDLTLDPPLKGQRLVLVGNSGGGTIAVESLELLQSQGVNIDQVILRGSPVLELMRGLRRIDYITAENPLTDWRNYSIGLNLRGNMWQEHRVSGFVGHVPTPQDTVRIADMIVDLLGR